MRVKLAPSPTIPYKPPIDLLPLIRACDSFTAIARFHLTDPRPERVAEALARLRDALAALPA